MSDHMLRATMGKDYLSAKEDLTFNIKHYFTMLTKFAEENLRFTKDIVAIVDARIAPKAEKLPALYLVDSTLKNLKSGYLVQFTENIITSFIYVFEKAEREARRRLRRLRNTWDEILPLEILHALDICVNSIDPTWAVRPLLPNVNSSFSQNHDFQQLADDKMESTAVNKSNSILQKHNHYQAPVRMDEDVELEVKINCAGNEARHAASVSEWRASSGAIEPARTAVCMEGREGPESDLHLIHKKKRDWSGSPPPSLPPDKRKDSHLLEQRLPILSSANLQHSEDLCQSGNRRQSEGKTFSQSGYNKGSITALSRNTSKRRKRTLEGGSSECPSKTFRSGQEDIKWPLHRLSVPANIHGGARQSFQVQPNMSHGASFSGLPVDGTGVPNSFLAPVAPFYHSCTLTTTSGNMNISVPAGRPLQGNNVWPNFAQPQPTVPYCQAQSVIPPTHNPLPFNQPAPAEPSKNQPTALRQKKEDVQKVPNLTGFVKEDMNKRYESVVIELYTGHQCSSCGVRFPLSKSDEYRDHLDWHFKQNSSKKVTRLTDKHREWHNSVQEWLECGDLTDLRQKAKKSTFFEHVDREAMQKTQEESKEELQIVTAAVNVVNESCEVCGEQFDMAWDDEREQWSLKNAIRFDIKTYHPSCYEDFTKVM